MIIQPDGGVAFSQDCHAQAFTAQLMGQLKQRLDYVGRHSSEEIEAFR
jgi:hypothetical protein